jgi:hypothetical protein
MQQVLLNLVRLLGLLALVLNTFSLPTSHPAANSTTMPKIKWRSKQDAFQNCQNGRIAPYIEQAFVDAELIVRNHTFHPFLESLLLTSNSAGKRI